MSLIFLGLLILVYEALLWLIHRAIVNRVVGPKPVRRSIGKRMSSGPSPDLVFPDEYYDEKEE